MRDEGRLSRARRKERLLKLAVRHYVSVWMLTKAAELVEEARVRTPISSCFWLFFGCVRHVCVLRWKFPLKLSYGGSILT